MEPENECSSGKQVTQLLVSGKGGWQGRHGKGHAPGQRVGNDQNSIRRNALMPMRSGIKVPRMPTIRLTMIAIDSQNRKPLWDMAMLADSGCSWPAKYR